MNMNTRKLVLAAVAVLCCGSAMAASWNAARWKDVYAAVPAPPDSLERAGQMIGPTKADSGNLGIVDPVLLKSRADIEAGLAAIEQASGDALKNGDTSASLASGSQAAGIDFARMQSDPAYAQQMQQKMASMSDAEKMQLAMQFNSGFMQSQQQAHARNPRGQATGIELASYIGQAAQTSASLHQRLTQRLATLSQRYDSQHRAIDAELQAALKACPATYQCGEAGCGPDPQCVNALNGRVPGVIGRHRKLAAAELTDMQKLYSEARSAQQPVIARIVELATAAEGAKAEADKLNGAYIGISGESTLLQSLTARAALRAGFWAGIQPRKIDNSFAYSGNLGYGYPLSADTQVYSPPDVPKGW